MAGTPKMMKNPRNLSRVNAASKNLSPLTGNKGDWQGWWIRVGKK
jgi:hypothetical protein